MSLTVTANFLTAASRRGAAPIWLVELPGLYRFLATTDPDHTENAWRFGDGLIVGAGAIFGGKRPVSDRRLEAETAVAGIRRALTESGNGDRLSRTQVQVLNQDGYGGLTTIQQLNNAKVRILLGFAGLDYADYALLMAGRCDNHELSWDYLTLDVTDARYQSHRDLSARLGEVYFTGAPSSSRGQAVPMLIGRVEDHTLLPVEGDASGTLGFAIETFHTYIRLNETTAGFPESGTIDLGTTAETGVPYSGRRLVVIQGQTYLQLENLVRTAPVAHNAGVAVDLASPSYAYLVGYQSGEVTAVYDDEVEVSTSNYSVEHNEGGADYPVCIVRFSAAPAGTITADVDGPDAEPPADLQNGDFETGDLTGWTVGADATASASSSDPGEGTYHLDLEGDDDTWRDVYQEVSTRRGRYYNVNLLYKDNDTGTNLLTNGSFETDATTGWTPDNDEISNTTLYGLTATPQRSLYTGFPARPNYGVVPDGDQALEIGVPNDHAGRVTTEWTYGFYQDVTTVVSSTYMFQFYHFGATSSEWVTFTPLASNSGSSGSGSSALPAQSQPTYRWQQVGYKLAADDDSVIYEDVLLDPVTYSRSFVPITTVFFTAQTTTTRVLIRVKSVKGGHSLTPPFAVRIDKVHLEETSDVKTSYTRVQVGTASDPSSALDEELEPSYNWREVDLSFKAPAGTTRLTLSSKWTGAQASSFFDDVAIEDAGRNPAQVIADLIDRFLPAWQRDVDSFDTAAQLLTGWQFQGVIDDPGASKARLEDLAYECKSSVLEGANDKLKLVVDEIADAPVMEFTTNNIDENSLRVRGESQDNLYTDFRLTFGPNEQIVSATPDDTTHPSEALDEKCQSALELYGARREFTRTLNYILDVGTAHKLLSYLVNRHTQRPYLVSLRTQDFQAVQIERGDTVAVTHPVLLVGGRAQCKVLEHDVKPDGVHLKLRTWGVTDLTLADLPELLPPITQGLRLWLKADDLLATYSDDDRIESWFDAHLGTIEFTSTGDNRPTLKENILNGHAVARFDPTSVSQEVSVAPNPLADLNGAAGLTVFIVSRLDVASSGVAWLYAWDPPANGFRISKFVSSDHAAFFQLTTNSAGFVYGATPLNDDTWHLLVCHYDGSVPSAELYLDGGEDDVLVSDNVPATLSMEADFLVVGSGASSNAMDGDIAEIMVYERAMSRAERKSIEHYLMTKYGLV